MKKNINVMELFALEAVGSLDTPRIAEFDFKVATRTVRKVSFLRTDRTT